MSDPNPEEMTEAEDSAVVSPLEQLLVKEVNASTKTAINEALNGIIGIQRDTHEVTPRDVFYDLDIQDRVVAWMVAQYAADLLQHGYHRANTGKATLDDVSAAVDAHPADVSDAALGHGDLRMERQNAPQIVRLPFERVRHASRSLKRSRDHADATTEEARGGG